MITPIPMKNNVLIIWNELEHESQIGFMKRLYSSELKFNVYCTFQVPEKLFGIALSFPKSIFFKLEPFKQLSELKIDIYKDSSFNDCNLLSVQLRDPLDKDIFSYLCENLIKKISEQDIIQQAVLVFGNTLLRWLKLFGKKHSSCLTNEEQQGLYGELVFLHKCLKSKLSPSFDILNFYVGVDKSLRDFQGSNWAVEVKTTSTNNPQELLINGERQLDDSMIDNLYLYHCSVEVSHLNGESLVDRIDLIKEFLKDDIASLSLFKMKLFEAGYFEEDMDFYKTRCYKLRSENIYHVTGEFPRIKELDLLPGVGNVRYGVTIANCGPYMVLETDVLNKCLSHD